MRRWLACGLVGFWCLGLSLSACGNDSSNPGTGPTADAAPTATTATPDGSTPPSAIVVNLPDVTAYVGATVTVDGSGVTATGFTWTVQSAPTGSAVTTASLQNATSTKPSFVADLGGDYVLSLQATGASSATGSGTQKVHAVAAPIFFMQLTNNANPPYIEYRAIGNDKSNNRPVDCRINGAPDSGPNDNQFISLSEIFADVGLDWWEAPPGSPSHAAFTVFVPFPDGGSDFRLALGTSDSTCQSPPVPVHRIDDAGTAAELLSILQPRYSPDGSRVAYVESRSSGYVVDAISFDGQDRRDISPYCLTGGTSSCWNPALFPPRPQWFADGHQIGWATQATLDGGASGWQVVVANDSANPQTHVYMTCQGGVPRSIAFLSDGSVLANPTQPSTNIEDLQIFKPGADGTCQVVRNLTNLGTPASYARDFQISPDGTEIAFLRVQDAPDASADAGTSRFGGMVYLAKLDGTSPPAPLGGGAEQYGLFGPRYVASASQVSWNGVVPTDAGDAPVDGGLPSINAAPRANGTTSNLVVSDTQAGIYVLGGGNGGSCDFRLCSFGVGGSSGGGALATAGLALVFVLRRRRNRGA